MATIKLASHFEYFEISSYEREAGRVSLEGRHTFYLDSKSRDSSLSLKILEHDRMRQAKEFAPLHPLPSECRMNLLLFFHGIFHAQRTEDPIFLRGSPGVALVGLRETDLGAACGHSDLHEARHGAAIEGVDPAIGDCDGGEGPKARHREPKARNERGVWGRSRLHRGLKEGAREPTGLHGRGVCEESPHINDKDAIIL